MEQILAEMPVGDRLREVAAGRGDDAHVDMHGRRPADAPKTLVDQHAQDFRLRLRRHVGDFVEIERAAMRLLERADPARPVGAGLDPEQFALHAVGRDRRRVDDDERAVGARGMGVDQARRQLLAGARGPGDQHARIGGADALDQPAQIGHRRGGADERQFGAGLCAQFADLAPQARGLERAFDDQDQPIGLERLLDEIIGAELDRGHRGLDVAVAGNHHHRHVGVLLLEDFQQLQAVELRALHPDVEQHQMRPPRGDRGDRLVGIAREPRLVALVLENAGNEFANVVFVIDDQNVGGHGSTRGL